MDAWRQRMLIDHADLVEDISERIKRCLAAGIPVDMPAHAALLVYGDTPEIRRTLARVNPDPAHQHPHDCPRCDGTGHVDTGNGYTPCT